MDRNVLIGGMLVGFGCGYILGEVNTKRIIHKRLSSKADLVANGLTSAVTTALRENQTPEQLHEALMSELEFIKIVAG